MHGTENRNEERIWFGRGSRKYTASRAHPGSPKDSSSDVHPRRGGDKRTVVGTRPARPSHPPVRTSRSLEQRIWFGKGSRKKLPPLRRLIDPNVLSLVPDQVAVLDIETLGLNPNKHPIAMAGLKIYARQTGDALPVLDEPWLTPTSYTCYIPDAQVTVSIPHAVVHQGEDSLRLLAGRLHAFPGPIVGHNLLEFDYRFLYEYMQLEGIIEKTVDTLYLLWRRAGKDMRGLSLDGLSAWNGGPNRQKLPLEDKFPVLWRSGRWDEVIAYNERDCDLTFQLWWHVVLWWRATMMKSWMPRWLGRIDVILLDPADLPELTGHTPTLGYAAWLEAVNTQTICGGCGRKVKPRILVPVSDDGLPLCAR